MEKQFGRNVRYWRQKCGLSVEMLFQRVSTQRMGKAEKAKWTDASYILKIERGEGKATLETADALAEALQIDVGELFR